MELTRCNKFGMREIHFKRYWETKGKERVETIYTYGLDVGPNIYVKYREGDYEIWHTPTHSYYSGIGMQRTALSTYYLVRTTNDVKADFLFEIEPGRHWAQGLELLKAKIDELITGEKES